MIFFGYLLGICAMAFIYKYCKPKKWLASQGDFDRGCAILLWPFTLFLFFLAGIYHGLIALGKWARYVED